MCIRDRRATAPNCQIHRKTERMPYAGSSPMPSVVCAPFACKVNSMDDRSPCHQMAHTLDNNTARK
eukprot:3247329-Alexandrium_andersonii.AAC.1